MKLPTRRILRVLGSTVLLLVIGLVLGLAWQGIVALATWFWNKDIALILGFGLIAGVFFWISWGEDAEKHPDPYGKAPDPRAEPYYPTGGLAPDEPALDFLKVIAQSHPPAHWTQFKIKWPPVPGNYYVVWGGSGSKVEVTMPLPGVLIQDGNDVTAQAYRYPLSVWTPRI